MPGGPLSPVYSARADKARCQSSAGYGASSLFKAYIEQDGPNWFVPVQLIGASEAGAIEKKWPKTNAATLGTRSRSNRERRA